MSTYFAVTLYGEAVHFNLPMAVESESDLEAIKGNIEKGLVVLCRLSDGHFVAAFNGPYRAMRALQHGDVMIDPNGSILTCNQPSQY